MKVSYFTFFFFLHGTAKKSTSLITHVLRATCYVLRDYIAAEVSPQRGSKS